MQIIYHFGAVELISSKHHAERTSLDLFRGDEKSIQVFEKLAQRKIKATKRRRRRSGDLDFGLK